MYIPNTRLNTPSKRPIYALNTPLHDRYKTDRNGFLRKLDDCINLSITQRMQTTIDDSPIIFTHYKKQHDVRRGGGRERGVAVYLFWSRSVSVCGVPPRLLVQSSARDLPAHSCYSLVPWSPHTQFTHAFSHLLSHLFSKRHRLSHTRTRHTMRIPHTTHTHTHTTQQVIRSRILRLDKKRPGGASPERASAPGGGGRRGSGGTGGGESKEGSAAARGGAAGAGASRAAGRGSGGVLGRAAGAGAEAGVVTPVKPKEVKPKAATKGTRPSPNTTSL